MSSCCPPSSASELPAQKPCCVAGSESQGQGGQDGTGTEAHAEAAKYLGIGEAFSAYFSRESLKAIARDFAKKNSYRKLRVLFLSAVGAGVIAGVAAASPMAGMYAAMAVSLALFGTFKHLGGEGFPEGFRKYDFVTARLFDKNLGSLKKLGRIYARAYPYLEQFQAAVYAGAAFALASGAHVGAAILLPVLLLSAGTKMSEMVGAFQAVRRGETSLCACVGGGDDAPPIGPVTVAENAVMVSMAAVMIMTMA